MAISIAFGISQCLSKNEKSFSYGDREQYIRVHISQKRRYILAVSSVLFISFDKELGEADEFLLWTECLGEETLWDQ